MSSEGDPRRLFPARLSVRRDVLWIAAIAIVYFAAARLSLSLLFQPEGIAAVWPPAGIFLSAILLTRRDLRPFLVGALYLTDLVAEMLAGTPILVSAVYALALAGDAALSSWLMLRLAGESISFRRVRDVIGFLFLSVILSNCLFSLMAAAAAASIPGTSFWTSWKWWAASDAIGNLVATPFLLSWAFLAKTGWGSWNPKRMLEGTVLFVSLGFLNHIAFTHLSEYGQFALVLSYFSFPFLLWAALRFGMRGVTLALVVLAAVSIQSAVAGRVPGVSIRGNRLDAVIIVQLYLAVMAIPSLILAAVMNERQQAEKKIRESQHLLRMLVEGTPDAVYIKDPRGRYLLFNAGASRITGKSADEVIGNDDTALFSADEARVIMEGDKRVIDTGKVMTYEEHVTTAEGEKATFLSTKGPIVAERGNVTGLFGIARDITERKRSEAALRESEARYRMLFEQAGDYVLLLEKDSDGIPVIADLNEAALAAHGYSRDQALGRPISFLEPGLTHEDDTLRRGRIADSGQPVIFSVRHHRKDGSVFDAEAQVRAVRLGGKDYFLSVERDVTERKRAEEVLAKSEANLAAAQRLAHIGSWEWDVAADTASWSDETYRIYGMLPRTLDDHRRNFVETIHPDDRARVDQALGDALDGTKEYDIEYRIVLSDKSVRFIHARAEVIRAGDGAPVSMRGTFHDVTDHKRAEAEKEHLQSQLQQAMKMEAVGRLAGGVAHDFNNLLTAIIGNISLALMKVSRTDPLAGMLGEAEKAAQRATTLVQQLLAFSRKQIIEPKVLDLNVLITDMHKMLIRLIGENIELQTIPGRDLGAVKADPGQFEQILVNLAVNARDAMPDGGKLVIETSNMELDAAYCARHHEARPGRYVMLAVSDTGHGMSEEVKARLFEPFFTTKPKGSGTGLGLATIYGAVTQAGGSVEVYSEPGEGTTFKVYLPMVAGKAGIGMPVREQGLQDVRGGGEALLLVEDEDLIRDLAVMFLGELGYKVLAAPNGDEAIRLAMARRERIDLLVTDVVLPGMNGRELSARLAGIHPEIKVLFTSGYTENVIAHHGVLDEGTAFIGKPYTPSNLAKKIRGILDKGC